MNIVHHAVNASTRARSLSQSPGPDNLGRHRVKKTSIFEEFQPKDFIISKKSRNNARTQFLNPNKEPRITINVNGHKYETYQATLDRYPNTLLGNKTTRDKYYNTTKNEITLSADLQIFEAVLFYYQSEGILARPTWVSEDEFQKELKFYQLLPKDEKKIERKCNDGTARQSEFSAVLTCVWNLMEHPRSSKPALICALISIITIMIAVIVFCLETVPSIVNIPEDTAKELSNRRYLFALETAVMIWFTVEYMLRLISARKRLKFIFSAMGVVDLLAVLPYYINVTLNEEMKAFDLSLVRILRMFRVLRIFKLSRYSTGLKVLGKTISASFGQLLALFLCLFLCAIIFASCLYYIEHVDVHSELDIKKEMFISIPDSFWYVIITMSSVGYGDVIPHTYIGKLVAAFCMISGIVVLLCLPTPVFITHFGRFYENVVNRPISSRNDLSNINNGIDQEDDGSFWENNIEENLFVPQWMVDNEWKEKMRKDIKQQMLLPAINVYVNSPRLHRTRSTDVLHNQYPSSP